MTNLPPTEPTPEDAHPTEVYPPAPPAPDYAAQAPYAAPAAPAYAQSGAPQPYAGAPVAPDTRPKRIAWTALTLAIAGIVLSLFGFVPILWVGFALALVGGLLLLAAFVFSIVGLAGKRNGGKPISIIALVLSVIGGFVGVFALVVSLVFIGLSATAGSSSSGSTDSEPAPAPSSSVSEGGTDEGSTDAGATTADEAAFLADVRPQVTEIMQQVDPAMTPEVVETAFPDENLILIGQALLATGEAGIDSFVDQTLASTGDVVSADQLRALYQAIYESAQAHLQ